MEPLKRSTFARSINTIQWDPSAIKPVIVRECASVFPYVKELEWSDPLGSDKCDVGHAAVEAVKSWRELKRIRAVSFTSSWGFDYPGYKMRVLADAFPLLFFFKGDGESGRAFELVQEGSRLAEEEVNNSWRFLRQEWTKIVGVKYAEVVSVVTLS